MRKKLELFFGLCMLLFFSFGCATKNAALDEEDEIITGKVAIFLVFSEQGEKGFLLEYDTEGLELSPGDVLYMIRADGRETRAVFVGMLDMEMQDTREVFFPVNSEIWIFVGVLAMASWPMLVVVFSVKSFINGGMPKVNPVHMAFVAIVVYAMAAGFCFWIVCVPPEQDGGLVYWVAAFGGVYVVMGVVSFGLRREMKINFQKLEWARSKALLKRR